MAWQLQEAKNRFSEVVDKAISDGPQEITRRGKKTAVLLSVKDYLKLLKRGKSIVKFFRDSPLADIDLERTRDFPRRIDL